MVDFEGQKFVETFTVSVVSSTSSVGFVLGYLLQDYNLMRNLIFAGIVASVVVTLPSWPFLKRNPIAWREIDDEQLSPPSGRSPPLLLDPLLLLLLLRAPFRETSSKPLLVRLLNASGVPRFEEVKHKTSRKKRIFC